MFHRFNVFSTLHINGQIICYYSLYDCFLPIVWENNNNLLAIIVRSRGVKLETARKIRDSGMAEDSNQGPLYFKSTTRPCYLHYWFNTSVINMVLFIAVEYKVAVTTGMKDGAGTDANVFITIYGSDRQTGEVKLKGSLFENNFEKGQ